jgi:hypothetical protein
MKNAIKSIFKLFILIILVAGAIASAISTVWTVIPDSSASKESMLGYKSHCSFAPISTIISILIAVVFSYILFRTKFLKLLS